MKLMQISAFKTQVMLVNLVPTEKRLMMLADAVLENVDPIIILASQFLLNRQHITEINHRLWPEVMSGNQSVYKQSLVCTKFLYGC